MKLTMSVGAAFGFAALAGCSQSGQDNYSDNADANAAYTTNDSVLPADENAAGADTLGNQMNQLNEGDGGNMADTDDAAENESNSY